MLRSHLIFVACSLTLSFNSAVRWWRSTQYRTLKFICTGVSEGRIKQSAQLIKIATRGPDIVLAAISRNLFTRLLDKHVSAMFYHGCSSIVHPSTTSLASKSRSSFLFCVAGSSEGRTHDHSTRVLSLCSSIGMVRTFVCSKISVLIHGCTSKSHHQITVEQWGSISYKGSWRTLEKSSALLSPSLSPPCLLSRTTSSLTRK